MKRILGTGLLIFAVALCSNTSAFAEATYTIVNSYNISSWGGATQPKGIEYVGGDLWIHKGKSLGKYDPDTSTFSTSYSNFPGHDLAWDGNSLWLNSEGSPDIYQIDPANGNILNTIYGPTQGSMGLTYDGTNLWSTMECELAGGAPGCSDFIRQIDQNTGSEIRNIPSPGKYTEGLGWDGAYIWTTTSTELWAIGGQQTIWQINPSDGSVMSSFASPQAVHDLAWGGGYLWLTSNDNGGTVYQLQVSGAAAPPVVPEPISSLLFIAGGATFAVRRFFEKFRQL